MTKQEYFEWCFFNSCENIYSGCVQDGDLMCRCVLHICRSFCHSTSTHALRRYYFVHSTCTYGCIIKQEFLLFFMHVIIYLHLYNFCYHVNHWVPHFNTPLWLLLLLSYLFQIQTLQVLL